MICHQRYFGISQSSRRTIRRREANIFHAHLLFLEDRSFLEKIIGLIHEGNSAVWSIYQSIQQYLKVFANMNDPYLKERGADVQNVGSAYSFISVMGNILLCKKKASSW